jgi:type VI secretion system protein ImpK
VPDSDDPFFRPDATSMRPRPGGRRPFAEAPRPHVPMPHATPDAEPISAAARAFLGIGLNPLVQAASPLLLLTAPVRGSVTPVDIPSLRQHALEEIGRFEEQARASGVPSEVVLAARYALCAGLDEAVLSTPWGHQSEWAQHPLLVVLHREAWGGEKFFEMLDRISQDPSRYIDLMELQYLCLAFGFAGKYQVQERGHERLLGVQQDLYRKIHAHRGPADLDLSLRWRGLEDRRNPLIRYVPWWVVGAAALLIVAIVFMLYRSWLGNVANPVQEELAKVGFEDFAPPAPPAPAVPAKGPTLRQLLDPDVQDGALQVAEEGNRTRITLLAYAGDLFPSGSATLNPVYEKTLQHVTTALNRVPGRVRVDGHTDDQRIRSLTFPDNYALSRARALSVMRLLERNIDDAARLTPFGAGSSRPLSQASDAESRARNRRVEIIHIRD